MPPAPKPDITESEWIVMEALWDKAPQTASEVAISLRPATGWADNTVRTLLSRLIDKSALKSAEQTPGPRLYLPAIKRDVCVRAESKSFLDRVFGGDAQPLLLYFAKNSQLSADEIQDLKNLLDEKLKS